MAEVEVQYIVPDIATTKARLHELRSIVHAMDTYRKGTKDRVNMRIDAGATQLGLRRTIGTTQNHAEVLEYGEQMRRELETHFSDDERDELVARFAGVVVRSAYDELGVE